MKLLHLFSLVIFLWSKCFHVCNGWPVSRAEIAVKTLMEIPQTHCLRYFKHDIHLMRRCRNHRLPMLRKPNKK